jgi:hypothetical protein
LIKHAQTTAGFEGEDFFHRRIHNGPNKESHKHHPAHGTRGTAHG